MIAGVLILLARILLAAMFLASGHAAIADIGAATAYFSGLGIGSTPALAWVVGIFELLAGVLLVVGFQTRRTAALLAAFTVAATYLGHYGQGSDQASMFMHAQMLMKDAAAAGGLVLLCLQGAGRISVDGALGAP